MKALTIPKIAITVTTAFFSMSLALAQDSAPTPQATPTPTLEERVAMLEGVVSQMIDSPEISQVVCKRDEANLNAVLAANPGAKVSAPTLGVFQGTGALICVTISKKLGVKSGE